MKPVALVCIAKNEDMYIEEWCLYHLKLGFDHIFIFQNDWRCDFTHERVTKYEFDGKGRQNEAYQCFINNHPQYGWAAFFDVDEFLVLKKHKTVQGFIKDYSAFNGVGINWVFFGDNSQPPSTTTKGVLQRFTGRCSEGNVQVKCIVKVHPSVRMCASPHVNKTIVTTHKIPFRSCRSPTIELDIAQLNHYFWKTEPEFRAKVARGHADRCRDKRIIPTFPIPGTSDVEDLLACEFLYGKQSCDR